MRIMAVDYGDVRTGIAVSDLSAKLAGEAWVLTEKDALTAAQKIAREAVSREVATIVVGHPINMDGSTGPRAEKSERLAEAIRGLCEADVVLWDERMTTLGANRILTETGRFGKKRKQTVDAVAASLILDSYLSFMTLQSGTQQ